MRRLSGEAEAVLAKYDAVCKALEDGSPECGLLFDEGKRMFLALSEEQQQALVPEFEERQASTLARFRLSAEDLAR